MSIILKWSGQSSIENAYSQLGIVIHLMFTRQSSKNFHTSVDNTIVSRWLRRFFILDLSMKFKWGFAINKNWMKYKISCAQTRCHALCAKLQLQKAASFVTTIQTLSFTNCLAFKSVLGKSFTFDGFEWSTKFARIVYSCFTQQER